MRLSKVAIVLFSLALLLVCADGFAQTRRKAPAVCSNVISLPNGAFIYKNSAPVRTGGVGTPLVGYRIEPTLIMNRSFTRGTSTIYSSNGTKIGSCPWASAHGAAGGRARCTMNTRSLRSAARRNGGSPGGYFKIGSSCAYVPDLGRCYGSVKGLCNRLIA